jgi:hypothetical protein
VSWNIWQVVEHQVDEEGEPADIRFERRMCSCPDPDTGEQWIEGYVNLFWKGSLPDWVYYEVRPS